ncbi:MAG: hypothetical protein M1150_03190 [Patescibacteria group bacterium]|nr:hypothetical protein [Patescibacteria group bacterium]
MTLSEVAESCRKFIRWGIVGIIALFILISLWNAAYNYWQATHPKPPPKPTVAFGKLPVLSTPPSLVNLTNLKLTLETINGKTPEVPTILPVYVMPHPQPNLLNDENAKKVALAFGFKNDPTVNSKTEYLWNDPNLPNQSFKINPLNGNFEYRYDYVNDPSVLNKPLSIKKEDAINLARGFVGSHVSLPDDLSGASSSVEFLKITQGAEEVVDSPSDGNAIRVNLSRKDLEFRDKKYPLITPSPKVSLVRVLISPSEDKRVLTVNYVYWPIEIQNSSTYPIKTAEQAWGEIQNGFGTLVYLERPNLVSAGIQNISLAYYDDEQPQNFLQPIYVFSGIGYTKDGLRSSFIIYLPAVTGEYIVKQ